MFVQEGQVSCVPETSRANEAARFEIAALPSRWREEAILLSVDATDSSIVDASSVCRQQGYR